MYRRIIDCYFAKGKLLAEHVSEALKLYGRFKVGDLRVVDEILQNEAPEEAQERAMPWPSGDLEPNWEEMAA
jgi:hypothetical protein